DDSRVLLLYLETVHNGINADHDATVESLTGLETLLHNLKGPSRHVTRLQAKRQEMREKEIRTRPMPMSYILVGTKSDRKGEREVSFEQGKAFAEEYNMSYMETSAKTGEGVESLFRSVAEAACASVEASADLYLEQPESPPSLVGQGAPFCCAM
ncbi:small GTPase superfamily, Ras type, partial [Kipferlia bialata]